MTAFIKQGACGGLTKELHKFRILWNNDFKMWQLDAIGVCQYIECTSPESTHMSRHWLLRSTWAAAWAARIELWAQLEEYSRFSIRQYRSIKAWRRLHGNDLRRNPPPKEVTT